MLCLFSLTAGTRIRWQTIYECFKMSQAETLTLSSCNLVGYFPLCYSNFKAGWSHFLSCGYSEPAAENAIENWQGDYASVELNEFPITEASVEQRVRYEMSTPGCGNEQDRLYLAHINTPNVARDLNLVRNLTGYTEMDWWGCGYGAVLAVTYAAMFPQNVGRMVLDGMSLKATLTKAPRNFPEYMRMATNALDYSFDSRAQIPQILYEFAGYCVEAAEISLDLCPLAAKSMGSKANARTSGLALRINEMVANLSRVSGFVDPDNSSHVLTFHELVTEIAQYLNTPKGFVTLAQTLLDAERIISNGKIHSQSHQRRDWLNSTYTSLTRTTLAHDDPFSVLALSCLDSNLTGKDTAETFSAYLHSLLDKDPLLAYGGFDYAACLSWPNLTNFDVERWRSPFSNVTHKLLLIPGTNDPSCSYASGLSTYNYVGSDNANVLVHDSVGHCSFNNPNTCTTNAIRNYFVSGTS